MVLLSSDLSTQMENEMSKSPKQILIVEDDVIIADQIAYQLKKLGYEVAEIIQSGEEALEWLEEHNADLILLDIFLSGKLDGFETAEQVVKLSPTPTIYVTSNPDVSHSDRLKISNTYGYLQKPVKEQELGRTIEYALYKWKVDSDIEESEAWLEQILKTISDGVIVLDHKARILFANKMAKNLFLLEDVDRSHAIDKQIVFHDLSSGKRLNTVFMSKDPDTKHRIRCVVNRDDTEKEVFAEIQVTKGDSDEIAYVLLVREISEQLRLEESLMQSREELRTLNQRLVDAQEDERKKLAHELHDDLGQYLVRLKIDIRGIEAEVKKQDEVSDTLSKKIETTKTLIGDTVKIVKNLTNMLRPQLIEHFGLSVAVEDMFRRIEENSELAVESNFDTNLDNHSYDFSIDLYRIIQESVTNALKHAEATVFTLDCYADGNDLHLLIKDDGKGFDVEKFEKGKSLGLIGLRERAFRWGGELDVRSTSGKGTTIELRIPNYEQYKRTSG